MNRIFKVIWSRTKGCYVVVAETAKNMFDNDIGICQDIRVCDCYGFIYVHDVSNDRAWEYYCARGWCSG